MKATIWSDEFMKLCDPESNEQFKKIVQHVDAYASKYLAQNNRYLNDCVNTLYKDLEIAKAENKGLKAAIRAQPAQDLIGEADDMVLPTVCHDCDLSADGTHEPTCPEAAVYAEADERELFEQWVKKEGPIQESFGVRSVNSMCDVAKLAWQARAAIAQSPARQELNAPHPDHIEHITFKGNDRVILSPEDYEELYLAAQPQQGATK